MPLQTYLSKVQSGEFEQDSRQKSAMERLDVLSDALKNHFAGARSSGGFGGLFRKKWQQAAPSFKGVYLYGGVGRGKSMIMDLFYKHVDVADKKRVHFHEFMQDVHQNLHKLRAQSHVKEPVEQAALDIAKDCKLLCFDEFHVVNIADAMILKKLFETLFEEGVLMVATSNWRPIDLYKDGLNRDRFLPFIDLLLEHVDEVALDGDKDYRLGRLTELPVYYSPISDEARRKMDEAFSMLTDAHEPEPRTLCVGTRTWKIPKACGRVARISFQELCDKPLGPADYLALTSLFDTIMVDEIPLLTRDRRNEARRFMTLVDACYERKVILILSAASPVEELYPKGDGAFEFQRTVSRLLEMRSKEYIENARNRPLGGENKTPSGFALTSDLI